MRILSTIVLISVCIVILYLLWSSDNKSVRTGTRSFYAKDRELTAYVRGEYLGGCFIPSMNILQRLSQEQIDSIVLVETILDN